jgi:hypothetical protein
MAAAATVSTAAAVAASATGVARGRRLMPAATRVRSGSRSARRAVRGCPISRRAVRRGVVRAFMHNRGRDAKRLVSLPVIPRLRVAGRGVALVSATRGRGRSETSPTRTTSISGGCSRRSDAIRTSKTAPAGSAAGSCRGDWLTAGMVRKYSRPLLKRLLLLLERRPLDRRGRRPRIEVRVLRERPRRHGRPLVVEA